MQILEAEQQNLTNNARSQMYNQPSQGPQAPLDVEVEYPVVGKVKRADIRTLTVVRIRSDRGIEMLRD